MHMACTNLENVLQIRRLEAQNTDYLEIQGHRKKGPVRHFQGAMT
jgi:hypothetical protein